VAALAARATGMFGGSHLPEPGRLGRVLLVAARTQRCNVEPRGLHLVEVRGVCRRRPVARLASHSGVFAGLPLPGLFDVTSGARLFPGVAQRFATNLLQRPGAVMSPLAEVRRNQRGTEAEENQKSGKKHNRGPDQMRRILPFAIQAFGSLRFSRPEISRRNTAPSPLAVMRLRRKVSSSLHPRPAASVHGQFPILRYSVLFVKIFVDPLLHIAAGGRSARRRAGQTSVSRPALRLPSQIPLRPHGLCSRTAGRKPYYRPAATCAPGWRTLRRRRN